MEEGKKKIIMIVVILACLVAAGIITYSTRSSSTAGGIESIKRGTMYWLKCRNPDCEHEWQMDKRDYFDYINEHRKDAPPMGAPPIVCPKCGEDSGYRAEKCEKCGLVFERGSVPNDLPDRCPKCGYSTTEEARKARKKARSKNEDE